MQTYLGETGKVQWGEVAVAVAIEVAMGSIEAVVLAASELEVQAVLVAIPNMMNSGEEKKVGARR